MCIHSVYLISCAIFHTDNEEKLRYLMHILFVIIFTAKIWCKYSYSISALSSVCFRKWWLNLRKNNQVPRWSNKDLDVLVKERLVKDSICSNPEWWEKLNSIKVLSFRLLVKKFYIPLYMKKCWCFSVRNM